MTNFGRSMFCVVIFSLIAISPVYSLHACEASSSECTGGWFAVQSKVETLSFLNYDENIHSGDVIVFNPTAAEQAVEGLDIPSGAYLVVDEPSGIYQTNEEKEYSKSDDRLGFQIDEEGRLFAVPITNFPGFEKDGLKAGISVEFRL